MFTETIHIQNFSEKLDTNYIPTANQENTVNAYVLLHSNTNYTPSVMTESLIIAFGS